MTTKVSLNSINISSFGGFKEGMFSFLILKDGAREGRVGGMEGEREEERERV